MARFLTGAKKNMVLLKMLKNKEVRSLDKSFLNYLRGALKYEKFVEIDGKVVLNSQMPPFGTEAFDRFLSLAPIIKEGKTAPISCHISVTQRCNFSCWHCSNWHREKTEDMPLDLIQNTIGRLQDMGNCLIGITGGEPTMRDDLEDIIRSIVPRSSALLFTNGTNVTPDRARELKKAGLFSIAISLDHFRPEYHNKARGDEKAFDIATRAIKNSIDAGLYTIAAAVPTREMIQQGEVPQFYDYCRDLGVQEIRVLAPIPTGRLVGHREKRWCGTDEQEQMWEYAKNLNLDKNYPRITEFSYLESEGILGCTAGTFHMFIETDGTVTPCDMIPLNFGNIKEEGIEKSYALMADTFKNPRYECFVRAATGLFKKAFAEEGKLPFSKEKTLEITSRIKNKKMPEFFQKMGMPQPVFEEKKPKVMKRERLDLRGLECPEPVFRTQEKIWEMEGGIIEVLLNDEQSKHNVTKTAEREGWGVEIKEEGNGEYLLVLAKT
jgi:MoaA/NifB/PqqE/SkfB family radical SAM enzyme/TusA-related sulfurtransferase